MWLAPGVVLLIAGPTISVMENWCPGKSVSKEDGAWDPRELGKVLPQMVAESQEHPMYARIREAMEAKAKAKL